MNKQEKILYISAGKGPAECEWVVMMLLSRLTTYLDTEKMRFEIVFASNGRYENTYKSIQLKIQGEDLIDKLSPWVGTIKWMGKSKYRPNHKRTNWFVSIDLMDAEVGLIINEKDLLYSTYKASGPGGQHRNKVESAVRVVHGPTGLEAISSDSRSQYQNRVIAKKRLLDKVELMKKSSKLDLSRAKNQMNNLLVRGNPVKVFSGDKFKEV